MLLTRVFSVFCRGALLAFCLTLSACAQLLSAPVNTEITEFTAGNYQLDPHHTTVLFKVDHLGVSSFVGRFNRVVAELDYNAKDPAASVIRAQVSLDSLDVNRPEFAETLTSCDWLCVEKHPKAHFESTGAAQRVGPTLTFPGNLQFHGVTAEAQLQVTLRGSTTNRLTGDELIGFDAELRFKRSDFGVDRYIPLVGDTVTIEVYAEFIRKQ